MDGMLGAMPFALLNEWAAFDRVEPLDPFARLEWMVGQLTAVVYNLWRGRDAKALQAEDFIPERKAAVVRDANDIQDEVKFWALDMRIKRMASEGMGPDEIARELGFVNGEL